MYKKIVLIGMRGSGKSHFGSCLASELGWSKIDMDDEIESTANKTINRIVETQGWEGFRDREHDITKKVSELHNIIISTGGGAIMYERNREYLLKDSLVIFLFSPFEDLCKRLSDDTTRPSLTEKQNLRDEIAAVWTERKDTYFKYSDIVFKAQEFPSRNSRNNVEINAKILAKRVKKLL